MANISGLAAQVLPVISSTLTDHVYNAYPTYGMFLQHRKEKWSGGLQYNPVRVNAKDSQTVAFTLTSTSTVGATTQSQNTVAATFNMTAYRTPYSVTFDEQLRAKGDLAKIKMLDSKLYQAVKDHTDQKARDFFTGNSVPGYLGLDMMISLTDSTPFFGSVDQSVDTNWAPQTNTSATKLTGLSVVDLQIEKQTDGSDYPDWGPTTEALFNRLKVLVRQGTVATDPEKNFSYARINAIDYSGVHFWKDKNATANALYIITSKYCGLYYDEEWDYKVSGLVFPVNYVYLTGQIISAVMFVAESRRRQGGFTNLTV